MRPGDVISYIELCSEEGFSLQKGMNFKTPKGYSIFLMSVRKNAPYNDQILDDGKVLIYEGHDLPKYKGLMQDPKKIDQPQFSENGRTLTENGKFFNAVKQYKAGNTPTLVKIYEKMRPGVWVYSGFFSLTDAWIETSNGRKVFKFKLEIISGKPTLCSNIALEHNRIIPTIIKLEVWKRDQGKCAHCGSNKNLHFDHILPFAKGGTSTDAKNIQLLCAKCNLSKHDKII